MTPGQTIQIEAVANGWIVSPAREPANPGYPLPWGGIHVFQDMEGRYGLLEWIATHFAPPAPAVAPTDPDDPFDRPTPDKPLLVPLDTRPHDSRP